MWDDQSNTLDFGFFWFLALCSLEAGVSVSSNINTTIFVGAHIGLYNTE